MRAFFSLLLFLLTPVLFATTPDKSTMKGAWQAYNVLNGVVTQRLPLQYVFGELGWGIKEGDAELQVQDWYQVREECLLLRPANLPKGFDPSAALILPIKGDAFILADPLVPKRVIRFERFTPTDPLTFDQLAGTYQMEVRDLDKGEVRNEPFQLIILTDGTYQLDPPSEKRLAYSTGRVLLTGDTFTLEPHTPTEGFWTKPTFFPYEGNYHYNHHEQSVRLIKQKTR